MRQYIDLITEASYDSMITALKAAYPNLADYITTQVRWAKAALKRDDRITWVSSGHIWRRGNRKHPASGYSLFWIQHSADRTV